MTGFIADQAESIRRRMEELQAERDLARTGSSAPSEVAEVAYGWPYVAADYDPA
jgi:hypothetical protein